MKRFFSLVGRATSSSSPSSPTSPPTTSPSETFTPPPPPPINTTITGNANTVKEAIEKFERSATNNADGAEGERTVKVSDGVRKGALVKAGTGGQKDVRQVAFKEDEGGSQKSLEAENLMRGQGKKRSSQSSYAIPGDDGEGLVVV
ncbi:hypothetical protein BT69DRAFT_1344251 [Atractiella rhizophila]|nr:hypothetical protein BT69DRAFT_1344251 [Atractiella rhizophila]